MAAGSRRPFWMSEIHFRSHFWPFQIKMQLFFKFLTKWLLSAILDVRNSLLIKFLAISDRYKLSVAILDVQKSFQINTTIFIFVNCFYKHGRRRPFWMSVIHFWSHFWPFRSICNFNFFFNFWQNGCCRPFWMSEIHFWSNFWPFHIDTQYLKNNCLHNGRWRPLWDVRNSLSIAFLPLQIDMQLNFFWKFLTKMAAVVDFGCPRFTFYRTSGHFR